MWLCPRTSEAITSSRFSSVQIVPGPLLLSTLDLKSQWKCSQVLQSVTSTRISQGTFKTLEPFVTSQHTCIKWLLPTWGTNEGYENTKFKNHWSLSVVLFYLNDKASISLYLNMKPDKAGELCGQLSWCGISLCGGWWRSLHKMAPEELGRLQTGISILGKQLIHFVKFNITSWGLPLPHYSLVP